MNGQKARYPNTMVYSGDTLQQRYISRTPVGVESSVFIVNATMNDPSNNGKFWIIDMDKLGNPEACSWGFIDEVTDPIDINPPLIPYLEWATCSYVGTNKIAGQRVYQYQMTNPKSYMAVSLNVVDSISFKIIMCFLERVLHQHSIFGSCPILHHHY
jgi:hypothetical protein